MNYFVANLLQIFDFEDPDEQLYFSVKRKFISNIYIVFMITRVKNNFLK